MQAQVLLKIVASQISNYCEVREVVPEKLRGFRPARSTVDMPFVWRLQELGQERKTALYHSQPAESVRLSTGICRWGRFSHCSAYQRSFCEEKDNVRDFVHLEDGVAVENEAQWLAFERRCGA